MTHIDKIIERFFTDANKFLPSGTAVKPITPDELRALLLEAVESYKKDAERLDTLDGNAKFRLGWEVMRAPIGNLVVHSVAFLGSKKPTTIREAIDAAIAAAEGK